MNPAILQTLIPAGCLRVPSSNVPPEIWASPELQDWKYLFQDGDVQTPHSLSPLVQAALLATPTLEPYSSLLRYHWIHVQFKSGIARVYILPHDVDRRSVSRKVAKDMSALLVQLDYSPETWNGSVDATPRSHPMSDDHDAADDEDMSLLERFNNVPSPKPSFQPECDFYSGKMQGLLDNDLPGLRTKLYPHQQRSAAVLLQREVDPGRMLDPRLRRALDQQNKPWYYDTVTGLVLRTPLHYDRVQGGILAEEMGTGKTLICLALILATKMWPTTPPEPLSIDVPVRRKLGSLVDMAAAAMNRHSLPRTDDLPESCLRALEKGENRALYDVKTSWVETRKGNRVKENPKPLRRIHLSSSTLVIVPNNLVAQWKREINKHTEGLKVVAIADLKDPIPDVTQLLGYDIIIFSLSRFEKIQRERSNPAEGPPLAINCPLEHIRFKRCIVDEGHKLGGGSAQWRGDLMTELDNLEIAARWVVTGTPSKGLYGVEGHPAKGKSHDLDIISKQEQQDLLRLGNIASKFLKVRPWANLKTEVGDTPADWSVYVMQPNHSKKSSGRRDCLRTTLNSLLIRHRLSDVSSLLPPVNEKIVILDGSYQDILALNMFSMMIIFNSVQSQRTDRDYFFHPKQQKSLTQLVTNLKQASFFGGVFYSVPDITKALETAQSFLDKKDVPISQEDTELLKTAIEFGHVALKNRLKAISNRYHAVPLYMEHFPGGDGRAWSLDDDCSTNELICTDAGLILSLQRYLNPCLDAPTSLQAIIESGRLADQGRAEVSQALLDRELESGEDGQAEGSQASSLAGNTALGNDHHTRPKSGNLKKSASTSETTEPTQAVGDVEIAEPLAKTRVISTASAKLSYLICNIVKYQDYDQIIVFYENDNVAYYLAQVLEILQIQHLIYAKSGNGLTAERRAQYVATFIYNQKFRVLLMDISQAAFGLDMRTASRIYFVSPVLNPQVEAQAIGRVRRISQQNTQKPVWVETLVLKGSIEELMIERRKDMTQAEHQRIKSVLDDRPLSKWILNAKIMPLPEAKDGVAETAALETPQYVFGRGFGRQLHPDDGLVTGSPENRAKTRADNRAVPEEPSVPIKLRGLKRSVARLTENGRVEQSVPAERPAKKRARVAFVEA